MTTAKQMALEALKIADAFCGSFTSEDCPDEVHIPIQEALAAVQADLARVVEPVAWISNESLSRLRIGGNDSKGTVPVHAGQSSVSKHPPYTAPQEPVNAWQSIETAPKDAEVLVWRDDSGAFIAKLTTPDAVFTDYEMEQNNMEFPDDFEEWWSDAYGWQEGDQKPTQWVPLPKPPGATT